MLLLILSNTGLTLLNPLILRDLIDKTIPAGNITRLIWLSLALLHVSHLSEEDPCCACQETSCCE